MCYVYLHQAIWKMKPEKIHSLNDPMIFFLIKKKLIHLHYVTYGGRRCHLNRSHHI
jgi:hypothetical protein